MHTKTYSHENSVPQAETHKTRSTRSHGLIPLLGNTPASPYPSLPTNTMQISSLTRQPHLRLVRQELFPFHTPVPRRKHRHNPTTGRVLRGRPEATPPPNRLGQRTNRNLLMTMVTPRRSLPTSAIRPMRTAGYGRAGGNSSARP